MLSDQSHKFNAFFPSKFQLDLSSSALNPTFSGGPAADPLQLCRHAAFVANAFKKPVDEAARDFGIERPDLR